MEGMNQHIMADDLAERIGQATAKANLDRNQGAQVSTDGIAPVGIEEYREAFRELGVETLPEDLATAKLDILRAQLYKLKQFYPEGTRVLLAAFPADANGRLYTPEEMQNHQYFKELFVDPESGLVSGYGAWAGGPYGALLPAEVQGQCSFDVHYNSTTPWASEEDFKAFSEKYLKAFHSLKTLLKSE